MGLRIRRIIYIMFNYCITDNSQWSTGTDRISSPLQLHHPPAHIQAGNSDHRSCSALAGCNRAASGMSVLLRWVRTPIRTRLGTASLPNSSSRRSATVLPLTRHQSPWPEVPWHRRMRLLQIARSFVCLRVDRESPTASPALSYIAQRQFH